MSAEFMIREYLDNNFKEDEKFLLIKRNGLTAIMENYYENYPLHDLAGRMKNDNRVIQIVKQDYMLRLFADFKDSNISVLYFKGEILQEALYKNIYLRPAGDIDIYVWPDTFDRSKELINKQGYTCIKKVRHHTQYIKGHISLELHRYLFHPAVELDESFFFDHLSLKDYKGYRHYIFDHTAELLYLFYHLYMHVLLDARTYDHIIGNSVNMAERFLFRAFEIAKYVEIYHKEIDWEQICLNIKAQRLRVDFKNMVTVIHSIFPGCFPVNFMVEAEKKEYC